MAVSSANPDELDAYVTGVQGLNSDVSTEVRDLWSAWWSYEGRPNDKPVNHAKDNIQFAQTVYNDFDQDGKFVAAVSNGFRKAGATHGVMSVDDAVIASSLTAAGVSATPPPIVTVDAPTCNGLTVDSGYANDPVNAASGNFAEAEVDLAVPPRIWALSWTRTYNSRHTARGPLGRGWSSWATTRLRIDHTGATWVGPDGKVERLARSASGFERSPTLAAEVVELEEGAELRWFDGPRWVYHRLSLPVLVEMEPGNAVAFTHDDDSRLVSLEHSGGRRLEIEWQANRIAAVRGSDGSTVTYTYDEAGDLVASVSPTDHRTYRLDESGRVTVVIDGDGVEIVRNSYDPDGRVVSQRSPHGRITGFQYHPGPVTVIDDETGGPRSVLFHDALGRLTGAMDANGARMTKSYDRNGNPVRITNRRGEVVVQEFDDRNRRVKRILPDGSEFRWTWDDLGRLLTLTSPLGTSVRMEYEGDERNPVRVIDPLGARTVVESAEGLISRVVDPDGVALAFEHDPSGNVIAMIDGLGQREVLDRDASGRIVSVTNPGGEVTRFEYDGGDRVSRRVDPDGGEWLFSWSPAGRLTETIDPSGARSTIRYGQHGDPEEHVDPLGAVTTMRTDVLGNLVGVVAADGAKFEFAYDGLSRLTALHDPAGGVTLREYDKEGDLVGLIDPLGNHRRVEVQRAGRLRRFISPDNEVSEEEYDPLGRLVRQVRPDGSSVEVGYDDAGRPVTRTDALGAVTHYEYSPGGRLVRLVSPLGHVTGWAHDAAGRAVERIDPNGGRTRLRRDPNGRVIEIEYPAGEIERFRYDPLGRPMEHHLANGGVIRRRFDHAGRMTEEVDAEGGARRFRYDLRGRMVGVVDPNGGTTAFAYNERGWLVSATDALGGVSTYEHDPLGRVTATDDQLRRRTTRDHDAAGRIVRTIDGSGRSTVYSYDAEGRLTTARSGTFELTVERDAVGRPVVVTSPAGTCRLEWDPEGRLVAKDDGISALRWKFDADGRRTAVTYPDGTVATYTYDPAGRLIGLAHPVAGEVLLRRDADGRVVSFEASGVNRLWAYTNGELTSFSRQSQKRVETVALRRDRSGRILEAASGELVQGFRYDPAGQLVEAGPASGTTAWDYDAAGRMVAEDGPSGTRRFSYDAAHQLTQLETDQERVTFEYDGSGRRLAERSSGQTRSFHWDALGALAQIEVLTQTGTSVTSLSRNALGELVAVGDTTVAWDPTSFAPQVRQLGSAQVIGSGEPLGTAGPRGVEWLDTDWLGTPGATSDVWGANGEAREPTLGYRGELQIGGLLWLRDRVYDPTTRVFLSPDRLAGVPGEPTFLNPYRYCHNNPLSFVDPLGLKPLTDAEFKKWQDDHPPWYEAAWNATTSFVHDHAGQILTGALAVAGVVMLFTPLAPIGAGILIGEASTLGLQVGMQAITTGHVDLGKVDWNSVAVGGALGGAFAGAGMGLSALRGAGAAAEAAPALEGGDTVQLFRHVDPAELEDIRNTGQFGLGPNSTGKYFAESAEHAKQWGQMLNNGEGAVVETNVPRSAADELFRWEKLDNIGPARYVSPEQLDRFNQVMDGIREVS